VQTAEGRRQQRGEDSRGEKTAEGRRPGEKDFDLVFF
jgi:hypothetical protein